ncbi:MAG TPA: ATP-binding protein [Polyangiaceae bacterium]|nr:ATP-binding protein [Polyangiaceae bacterium]
MVDAHATITDAPSIHEGTVANMPSFPDASDTGAVIARKDWRATALGAIERWPAVLRRTVRVCLESGFPFAIAWGPERTQLYNDAFSSICGGKHPAALGQDMRTCWASAWPVLGPSFERAQSGIGSFVEDGRLFLDRRGVLEEAFLSFSFSPIRDDDGAIPGVLLTVIETTQKVLEARRATLLRDLLTSSAAAESVGEAWVLAMRALDGAPFDVPFAFVYAIDASGNEVELVARTQSTPERYCPAKLDLRPERARWPLAEVLRAKRYRVLDGLSERFELETIGPYPEPPRSAILLPISLPGSHSPHALLMVGTSPRLILDHQYCAFFDRVAATMATSVASARAHEEQRRRAEQLSALDRAKTTFFSNVSHEFRTPLTLLAGPLEDELAERESPLPEARRERLATAHRNTLRLIKLVNVLLDFSRIEAGRSMARYQPTQLGTLTSELASLFRAAIERAGLTLSVEIEPQAELVFVDRDMWEKIVLNLVSNAFKHTFAGGIRVRLRYSPVAAELDVIDSGIGIAEHELGALFDRFHRVYGAKSRTHEGSGIGLPLVRELSRLHGGDVRVVSKPDYGSRFTVTIPLGNAHLPVEQVDVDASPTPTAAGVPAYVQEAMQWATWQAEGGNAVSPSEPPSQGRATMLGKVLLAEDSADMRAYIVGLLTSGYQVLALPDGQAALDAIASFQPDLLLTDVMMPRLDGLQLLRAVRGDLRTRQLPVIFLSARAGEEAALEGIEAGADDYLVKPFAARELLARVRTHVELSRARRDWAAHLEQTNQELEAFSYSVSHDLRTPLRAIDGFSQAILVHKSGQLDEEGKQYLARVRKAASRMGELIDELLALSRVSRAPLRRQNTSLTALAERLVREQRERQPAHPVNFEAEPNLVVHADARLLEILLEKLLENSWKFTARRSDARVRVGRVTADTPTFYVADNGAGFDQTYAHRLFQPFQRLHTDADFPGTGIGLAIVQRIVARHGGRICAEGREGQGATFYFSVPST